MFWRITELPQFRREKSGAVRAPKDIVNGDIIIVGKTDEHLIARLPCAALVSADAVLTDVQIHGDLELCVVFGFSELSQARLHEKHLLTVEYQNGILLISHFGILSVAEVKCSGI